MIKEDGKLLPEYLPGGEKWRGDIRFFREKKNLGGYRAYMTITKTLPIG